MRRIAMAAGLLFAGAARAEEWTALDTVMEAGYAAAVTADYLETRASLMRGGIELNPILGLHPSQIELAGYNAGLVAVHAGVAALLPKPYRTIWQALGIGIEAHTVYRNWRVGATIRF